MEILEQGPRWNTPTMADLPVILRVQGRRCLIVGGGVVALRRAKVLLQCGAVVTLVAPRLHDELHHLPMTIHTRGYETSDLDQQWLAVIATDDAAINDRVHEEAQARGMLVNRADDSLLGDLQIPAHHHQGPITLAVHTQGISAQAAATIRNQLVQALDPAWPVLLEVVRPYRETIQSRCPDSRLRQQKLRELTGEKAMNLLQSQGIRALRQYCDALLPAEDPA